MKRPFYVIACLVLLIASCKDDDEVPSRTIFEFRGKGVWAGADDSWIALYDNESGEFIDSKQVFPNQTTTFESTKNIPGNKLTVSILLSSAPNFGTIGYAYSDIDVGAKWSFGTISGSGNPNVQHNIGQFDLEITNVPSLFSLAMSAGSSETTYPGDLVYEGQTITTTAQATTEPQLLYLDTGNDNPKYLELSNTQPNQATSIDYGDFQDFDKYVNVTFSQPLVISAVYFLANYSHPLFYDGYTFVNYTPWRGFGPSSELTLGFLNKYTNYNIYIYAGPWIYQSYGAAPASIQYVDSEGYTTSGNNPQDFKVTSTNDYIYSISSFGYSVSGNYLNISYHFEKGKEKIFDVIPGDFADKYNINKDAIIYGNTKFAVTGRSYDEMVRYLYDDTYDLNTTWTEGIVSGVK